MTDVHCHVTGGNPSVREFQIGREFVGVHPWEAEGFGGHGDLDGLENWLRGQLDDRSAGALRGIGEIGLDRLKDRIISPRMREVFALQLRLAGEYELPVALHGAKCWGQVVEAVRRQNGVGSAIPSFLCHGFSRSDGLIPDIVAMNGYISVGPAILNEHAINYRELVKKIPLDRLLIETDRTAETSGTCPPIGAIAEKLAELRSMPPSEMERLTDLNAEEFLEGKR